MYVNSKISITTKTEGRTQSFCTEGLSERTAEGLVIRYKQDGDDVTLVFAQSAFQMSRLGETELTAEFCAGRRTVMRLSSGSHSAEIPVETAVYEFRPHAEGFAATLYYDLIFSEHLQNFQLELFIKIPEAK